MKTLVSSSAILCALMLIQATAHTATITVTSNADIGTGTLRDAIIAANTTTTADIITFNIAPGGPQHILLNSALPLITRDLTIDGTTQPGFSSYTYPIIKVGENFGADAIFKANGGITTFISLDVSYTGTSTTKGKGFYVTSTNKACTIENCWARNRQDGIVIRFAGTQQVKVVGNDLTDSGDKISGGSAFELGHKDGSIKAHSNKFGGITWRAIFFDVVSNVIMGSSSGDIQLGTGMKELPEPIRIEGGTNITVTGLDLAKTGAKGSYGVYSRNTTGITVTNCIFKNRFPGLGLRINKGYIVVTCNLFQYNDLGIEFDGIVAGTTQKIQNNNFICNLRAVRQFVGQQMQAQSNFWNTVNPPLPAVFNGHDGNVDVSNYSPIPIACALPAEWLCGNAKDQVWICHNTGSSSQNMCVNLSDVKMHLSHGDYLGKCNPDCCWRN